MADKYRRASEEDRGPTRHAAQVAADVDFAMGRISVAQWREKTEELSDPEKWNAAGRIRA